jgi:hypothetical protein
MLPPMRKGSAFPASFTISLREAQPREGSLGVIGNAITISLRWSESQLTAALESWPSAMAHDF